MRSSCCAISHGRTNEEIAQALVITDKTASHQLEHICAEAGVFTGVGTALFAMLHDLNE